VLYPVKTYLKFLKNSTNQHGVHSPFVYDLLTKCLYTKANPANYVTLTKHREWLLSNTKTITVTDFGAGSRVFKSNERKVSAIAKNAGITKKRQLLLSKLVAYFSPSEILEIGTSLGLATAAMRSGNRNSTITTVEGCKATSKVAQDGWNRFSFDNITQVTMNFDDFFETAHFRSELDFVFVDGNHSKEATLNYFKKLLPVMTNNGVIIFDDIYWGKEMTAAWQEICAHNKVTVSIDTYQWGLVFFRKEQQKEHFILRV